MAYHSKYKQQSKFWALFLNEKKKVLNKPAKSKFVNHKRLRPTVYAKKKMQILKWSLSIYCLFYQV